MKQICVKFYLHNHCLNKVGVLLSYFSFSFMALYLASLKIAGGLDQVNKNLKELFESAPALSVEERERRFEKLLNVIPIHQLSGCKKSNSPVPFQSRTVELRENQLWF